MIDPEVIAGRYTLVRRIGAGAMGTVWLARDEILHREVAVKQVTGPAYTFGAGAEVMRERAMREGRMLARLSHPNAVGIYDVVIQDGEPWLVMEYLRSRNLSETVRDGGPLEPQRAAAIGAQLADALAEAHRVGVVHRDVKPGNVLLTDTGTAKITDFGIARGGADTLTETGLLAATPAYLSPETARGADPAPAADVWSLGATLYFAVEGRPPFGTEGGPLAVLARVANSPLPAPTHAGPLAPVLLRLLAHEAAQRPTMAQASEMLRAVRADTAAAPDGATDPDPATAEQPATATMPLPAPMRRWASPPVTPSEPPPTPASASPAAPPVPASASPASASPASAPPPAPPAPASAPAASASPAAPAARASASPASAPAASASPAAPPAAAAEPWAERRPTRTPPRSGGVAPRSRGTLWLAACAAVLALAGLGWYLFGGHPAQPGGAAGQRPAAQAPSGGPTASTTTTGAGSAGASAPPSNPGSPMQSGMMTRFVADYYRLLPGNTAAGWRLLGPSLKRIGYHSYTHFWSTIRAVSVRDMSADPANSTVTGTVVFVTAHGRTSTSTERHTFTLVTTPDGTGLLIDRDHLTG